MAGDIRFTQGPIGWQAPIKANCVRFTIWKFKTKKNVPHDTSTYASSLVFFFQGFQSIRERRKGWFRMSSPVGTCCLSVSSCHCWPWSIPSVFLRCWAHFSEEKWKTTRRRKGDFESCKYAINIQNACSYLLHLYSMYVLPWLSHNVKICKDHSKGSSRNALVQPSSKKIVKWDILPKDLTENINMIGNMRWKPVKWS